jgi:hypothetical protein
MSASEVNRSLFRLRESAFAVPVGGKAIIAVTLHMSAYGP